MANEYFLSNDKSILTEKFIEEKEVEFHKVDIERQIAHLKSLLAKFK